MRIMYLTDVGFDNPNSNNHLVESMLKSFLEKGHDVYLVQSHTTGKEPDIPQDLKKYNKFKCDTIAMPIVRKSNFILRYLSAIRYEFLAKKRWIKEIKTVDIVLLQSHYTAVYSCMLLSKYNRNIVFNIYDIFPGEAYTNKNIKSKLVYDFFYHVQKYLYKYCISLFTLTPDTRTTLLGLGVDKNKIHIIPNWFNEQQIHEVKFEDNTFIMEVGMDREHKYVQYAGSLGVSYDFDLIIRIAEKMRNREDIIFQIVGNGLKYEHIINTIKDKQLNNVQVLPWQPVERLSEVYSACTMQIVPLRKDVIKNSYPSKILPLMACSRVPIVSVEKESYFYDQINSEKVGVAIPIGDIELLKKNIELIADDVDLRNEMQNNAYKFVHNNYTVEKNTCLMLEVFTEIQKGSL